MHLWIQFHILATFSFSGNLKSIILKRKQNNQNYDVETIQNKTTVRKRCVNRTCFSNVQLLSTWLCTTGVSHKLVKETYNVLYKINWAKSKIHLFSQTVFSFRQILPSLFLFSIGGVSNFSFKLR